MFIEGEGMDFERIGGRDIFRPRCSTELQIRIAAERDLRQHYSAGRYSSRDDVNAILQHRFSYYDRRLKEQLPRCASRHLMQFVLSQYDKSCEVETQVKNGQLPLTEQQRWRKLGPIIRRAIKYLAECIAMAEPEEAPQCMNGDIQDLLDECWVYSEELVELSILSSQTYMLFPEQTTLDIRPPGELEYLILEVEDATRYEGFQQRVTADTAIRSQFIAHDELFGVDRVQHHLDHSFKSTLGFSLSEAFSFAGNLVRNAIVPYKGFDIPFVRKEGIVKALNADLRLSEAQANRLLEGLVLRPSRMRMQNDGDGRIVWKPNQEYRAFARPFFEFPHETGTHLVWSRQMAQECLAAGLFMRLAQGHAPLEWKTKETQLALEKYTASVTRTFEDIVLRELKKAGVPAGRFNNAIGSLSIPQDIGEIDCLAYVPNSLLLLVADCKYVKPTSEPATFRGDLSRFVNDEHNYRNQAIRKATWVKNNLNTVKDALVALDSFPNDIQVRDVAPALVTYSPAFASLFIEDVACISIAELLTGIKSGQPQAYPPLNPS